MRGTTLQGNHVLVGIWVTIAAGAAAQSPDTETIRILRGELNTPPEQRTDKASSVEFFSLPSDVETQRHYYNARTDRTGASDTTRELVYSNTADSIIVAPAQNQLIMEDVTTIAIGGCQMPDVWLSAYEILVGVHDSNGGGDPYTVEFGIWDACPGANPPGQLIPGTEGSFSLEDDGLVHLITVDLEGVGVSVGRQFCVGLGFSGNPNAGWVWAGEAEIGFTEEPGYLLEVWCGGEVGREFLAYYNLSFEGGIAAPGPAQWIADDATLIVDDCELSSFEVGVIGTSGSFNMQVELWSRWCDPDMVIEGTQRTYSGRGDGTAELARFTFVDEEGHGIPIAETVWIAWRFNKANVGPIISGYPVLGHSEDLFTYWDLCQDLNGPQCNGNGEGCLTDEDCEPGETCDLVPTCCNEACYFWFSGDPYAAFTATIRCIGDPAMGACCDLTTDQPFCHEVPQIECIGPGMWWWEDVTCDELEPPCGYAACCWPDGSCEDLTQSDCWALGGWEWFPGSFCSDTGFICPWDVCHFGEGSCCEAHPYPEKGCDDPVCCDHICSDFGPTGAYCCEWHWDSWCANTAQESCGYCNCAIRNNECEGAYEVVFDEQCWNQEGVLCAQVSNVCATTNSDDPGFCCHPAGAGTQGAGSLWYTFEAPAEKVEIDTCCSSTGEDSLIEVYSVGDPSTPEAACATLTPIACNDDGGCDGLGQSPQNSRMNVFGLTVGETYYIQLASKTTQTTGRYKLKISPTSATPPPDYSYCKWALPAGLGSTPFDVEDTLLDCPIEPLLPTMQNDVWFDFLAFEGGLYIATTCPATGPGPDTTLAVYRTEGINEQDWCPVDPEWRVAVNDDRGGDCGSGSRVFFSHPGGMTVFKIRVGGENGSEPSGMLTIRRVGDFIAYLNPDPDGPIYVPGPDQWMADDLTLTVDDCVLSSLEVAVAGANGPFTMDVELWNRWCDPDMVIEETQRTYQGRGDCSSELAHFEFPGGLDLGGGDEMWIAYRFDEDNTGPIIAGEPILGESADVFALWDEINGCAWWWFSGSPYAAFNATIRCLGEAPLGACCDLSMPADDYCREVPLIECLGPLARWAEARTCDEFDAFDPPCGYSACCLPPVNPYLGSEACLDLPQYDPPIPCIEDEDCPNLDCPPGGGFCETGFGLPIPCSNDLDCPPGILCNLETWYCERGFGCSEIFQRILCDPDSDCPSGTCDIASGTCDGGPNHGEPCNPNVDCPNEDCDIDRGYCIQVVEEEPAIWSPGKFCSIEPRKECFLWACLFAEGPCDAAQPWPEVGCNDPECCDKVCRWDPQCCLYNWDQTCASWADWLCEYVPMNDECIDAIEMEEGCWPWCLCAQVSNARATVNPDDPGFCCHPAGAGNLGYGSVWFKFVATQDSARIDTCASATGEDSLIEVYDVGDSSTPQSACATLTPIACNDDGPCSGTGQNPRNSRLDVWGLTPGETYYIQLASKTSETAGRFKVLVDFAAPAPAPPPNNTCADATPIAVNVPRPFDLADSTMDCPIELHLPAMQNDVWFDFLAFYPGLYTVETCGPDAESSPDTTLSVYEGSDCPVDHERQVTCNDDGLLDYCGLGSRAFFPADGGAIYKIRVGGEDGSEPWGTLMIRHAEDCQPNNVPDADEIASCRSDNPNCQDCNGNDVPDECDIADGTSDDINANAVPDECEPGDFNGDGKVDLPDFADFVDCLTGPCGNPPCEPPLYSDPACRIGDFGYDGDVDLSDFGGFQVTFTGP